MLIDTHAHLDFPEFTQLSSVLQRARSRGIGGIVTIGIDVASSRKAVDLAQARQGIHATVGIHPHGAKPLDKAARRELRRLSREPKVVAIGEIGLDYYRNRQPRDTQKECLRQQVEIACEAKLPAVFHVRDAYDDFLSIIGKHVDELKGAVVHCFSSDWTTADQCLQWGFYLSIPGTVTYPKSEAQREVVARMPADRILLETDCPFLAPAPHRGRTNEPALMVHTAAKVAELRRVSLEALADQTTRNARAIFGLSRDQILQ